jgi:hypothetical protein
MRGGDEFKKGAENARVKYLERCAVSMLMTRRWVICDDVVGCRARCDCGWRSRFVGVEGKNSKADGWLVEVLRFPLDGR